MSIPVFKTERLELRGITEGDISAFEEHFVDYEVIRNLSASVPWPYPEDGVRNYVLSQVLPNQGHGRWVWGIFHRDNPDELMGNVELWRTVPEAPENRGFWLGRKFWGCGYMTEAVEPVMNYAFDELGFGKLVFANARGNLRSRRIKEKTGARLLRVDRANYVDPGLTEREIWELTKEEWCTANL